MVSVTLTRTISVKGVFCGKPSTLLPHPGCCPRLRFLQRKVFSSEQCRLHHPPNSRENVFPQCPKLLFKHFQPWHDCAYINKLKAYDTVIIYSLFYITLINQTWILKTNHLGNTFRFQSDFCFTVSLFAFGAGDCGLWGCRVDLLRTISVKYFNILAFWFRFDGKVAYFFFLFAIRHGNLCQPSPFIGMASVGGGSLYI